MTRTQALAIIAAKLAALDDERVLAVADIVQALDATDDLPRELTERELTERELALIEQSKEDFRTGRSYSLDEARTLTDELLTKRGVAPSPRDPNLLGLRDLVHRERQTR